MFSFSSAVRVFVYREPCSMHCSFERLTALARNELKQEPSSGHLFLFLNRQRTAVKILYFDRTGYCNWYRRLESGTFSRSPGTEVDYRTLSGMPEGFDVHKITKISSIIEGKRQTL